MEASTKLILFIFPKSTSEFTPEPVEPSFSVEYASYVITKIKEFVQSILSNLRPAPLEGDALAIRGRLQTTLLEMDENIHTAHLAKTIDDYARRILRAKPEEVTLTLSEKNVQMSYGTYTSAPTRYTNTEIHLPHSSDSERRSFIFSLSITKSEVEAVISSTVSSHFLSDRHFTIEEKRTVVSTIAECVTKDSLTEITISPLQSNPKAQGPRIGLDLLLPITGKDPDLADFSTNIKARKVKNLTDKDFRARDLGLGLFLGILLCV